MTLTKTSLSDGEASIDRAVAPIITPEAFHHFEPLRQQSAPVEVKRWPGWLRLLVIGVLTVASWTILGYASALIL